MTLERLIQCQGQNRVRSFRPACQDDCQYRFRSRDIQETSLQSPHLVHAASCQLHEPLRQEQPVLYPVFRIVGLFPAGKRLRVCELKGSGLPVAIVPVIQVDRPNRRCLVMSDCHE
jgi:hypothetical protein